MLWFSNVGQQKQLTWKNDSLKSVHVTAINYRANIYFLTKTEMKIRK